MIVVGAGPAGSTTARYAAGHGHSVLLIDRRKTIGVPVQCGEYVAHNSEVRVMFPGVSDLDDLMRGPYSVKRIDTDKIRIISPRDRRFELEFRGFTVDRDLMDQKNAELAVDSGAELRTEVTALDVRGSKVHTTEGVLEGRVIVAADGPMSRLAKCVGLDWPISAPAMTTCLPGDFSSVTELYFGDLAPGGYAWVIPKGETANIGLGVWPKYKGRLDALFRSFLKRLDLPTAHGTGGYVPIMGPVSRTVMGNLLLVGDSAGHVMPTNGGGINVSMICGRIAGETINEHLTRGLPLGEYEARWSHVVGRPLERGRKIRRLGDMFFGKEWRLEQSMRVLGRRGMGRAIRCKRLFIGR